MKNIEGSICTGEPQIIKNVTNETGRAQFYFLASAANVASYGSAHYASDKAKSSDQR